MADDFAHAQRLARLELSALLQSGVLGMEGFEGARISSRGTVIHDTNGSALYRRIPLRRGHRWAGHVDVAVEPALGQPLLAASPTPWNERSIRAQAHAVAEQRGIGSYDALRFVAYSFPKIAIQFLERGREVSMLELGSWNPVPEESDHEEPGQFERWSLLASISDPRREAHRAEFSARLEAWSRFEGDAEAHGGPPLLALTLVPAGTTPPIPDQQVLRYSTRSSDHHPCAEPRIQETSEWCVAAGVQMFLEFWRYEYAQTRIADLLGLGSTIAPKWLPDNRAGDVPVAIEALTSNALRARLHSEPDWSLFRAEIRSNRPVISVIPGHARMVVGYTERTRGPDWGPTRGLFVYDPLPVDSGVNIVWERFGAHRHKFAYTALLTAP